MYDITTIIDGISITDADTAKKENLIELGFNSIICLDPDFFWIDYGEGIEAKLFPLGQALPRREIFMAAVTQICKWRSETKNILTHCQLGVNRSVSIVAASLVPLLRITPGESLDFVSQKRSAPNSVTRCYRLAVYGKFFI